MRDYPFTILDVAGILNLKVRRRQPTNGRGLSFLRT